MNCIMGRGIFPSIMVFIIIFSMEHIVDAMKCMDRPRRSNLSHQWHGKAYGSLPVQLKPDPIPETMADFFKILPFSRGGDAQDMLSPGQTSNKPHNIFDMGETPLSSPKITEEILSEVPSFSAGILPTIHTTSKNLDFSGKSFQGHRNTVNHMDATLLPSTVYRPLSSPPPSFKPFKRPHPGDINSQRHPRKRARVDIGDATRTSLPLNPIQIDINSPSGEHEHVEAIGSKRARPDDIDVEPFPTKRGRYGDGGENKLPFRPIADLPLGQMKSAMNSMKEARVPAEDETHIGNPNFNIDDKTSSHRVASKRPYDSDEYSKENGNKRFRYNMNGPIEIDIPSNRVGSNPFLPAKPTVEANTEGEPDRSDQIESLQETSTAQDQNDNNPYHRKHSHLAHFDYTLPTVVILPPKIDEPNPKSTEKYGYTFQSPPIADILTSNKKLSGDGNLQPTTSQSSVESSAASTLGNKAMEPPPLQNTSKNNVRFAATVEDVPETPVSVSTPQSPPRTSSHNSAERAPLNLSQMGRSLPLHANREGSTNPHLQVPSQPTLSLSDHYPKRSDQEATISNLLASPKDTDTSKALETKIDDTMSSSPQRPLEGMATLSSTPPPAPPISISMPRTKPASHIYSPNSHTSPILTMPILHTPPNPSVSNEPSHDHNHSRFHLSHPTTASHGKLHPEPLGTTIHNEIETKTQDIVNRPQNRRVSDVVEIPVSFPPPQATADLLIYENERIRKMLLFRERETHLSRFKRTVQHHGPKFCQYYLHEMRSYQRAAYVIISDYEPDSRKHEQLREYREPISMEQFETDFCNLLDMIDLLQYYFSPMTEQACYQGHCDSAVLAELIEYTRLANDIKNLLCLTTFINWDMYKFINNRMDTVFGNLWIAVYGINNRNRACLKSHCHLSPTDLRVLVSGIQHDIEHKSFINISSQRSEREANYDNIRQIIDLCQRATRASYIQDILTDAIETLDWLKQMLGYR